MAKSMMTGTVPSSGRSGTDEVKRRLVSATLCWRWSHCLADQLWLLMHTQEEELKFLAWKRLFHSQHSVAFFTDLSSFSCVLIRDLWGKVGQIVRLLPDQQCQRKFKALTSTGVNHSSEVIVSWSTESWEKVDQTPQRRYPSSNSIHCKTCLCISSTDHVSSATWSHKKKWNGGWSSNQIVLSALTSLQLWNMACSFRWYTFCLRWIIHFGRCSILFGERV